MNSQTIKTRSGEVKGIEENGISRFLGIPYAEPPVGDLRWRAPVPVTPWKETRDATKFGFSAPQAPVAGLQKLIGISGNPTNEDCLFLNVWTPGADDLKRPVLFWIHGGANTLGSGSQPRINGEHLARRGDTVVVTFNYRLGALGFLHAPALGASGNEALLDQVEALKWVRDNIAAFGGDPENVTVFGQSAGGFNIGALMGMEQAAGLFHKAVPMSGSLGMHRTVEEARVTTDALAQSFGGVEKLRDVSSDDILQWQLASSYGYGAVHDGEVIEAPLAETLGSGTYTKGIPLMIGSCEHESALWTAMNPKMQAMTRDDFEGRVRHIHGERAEAMILAYAEGRSPVNAWTAIMTDNTFRIPAIRTADLHRQHTPDTWMYLFDHQSPAMEGRLGSVHSLDIPFVFGTLTAEGMDEFCGRGEEVESLSAALMDTYLHFARTGNPGHEGIPAWHRYDDNRTTMCFGSEQGIRTQNDPMSAERQSWGGD
ncbi:MAG: carboxylesterase/lipase family protein [Pseudomonadota bacterium]